MVAGSVFSGLIGARRLPELVSWYSTETNWIIKWETTNYMFRILFFLVDTSDSDEKWISMEGGYSTMSPPEQVNEGSS